MQPHAQVQEALAQQTEGQPTVQSDSATLFLATPTKVTLAGGGFTSNGAGTASTSEPGVSTGVALTVVATAPPPPFPFLQLARYQHDKLVVKNLATQPHIQV